MTIETSLSLLVTLGLPALWWSVFYFSDIMYSLRKLSGREGRSALPAAEQEP